jgi:cytochrome c-type biogenesis protein CcmE
MTLVLGIVAGVSIAGALALTAFRQNVTFFFDPTAVADGQAPAGERFRLGGMVTKGSVQRAPGSLEVHFVVTDFKHEVPVSYTGVLPDLFREGQGVVAHGRMSGGTFVADEVLAKHDEKYMPPEVARSLKKREAEAAGPPGAAVTPTPGVRASGPTRVSAPAAAPVAASGPATGARAQGSAPAATVAQTSIPGGT